MWKKVGPTGATGGSIGNVVVHLVLLMIMGIIISILGGQLMTIGEKAKNARCQKSIKLWHEGRFECAESTRVPSGDHRLQQMLEKRRKREFRQKNSPSRGGIIFFCGPHKIPCSWTNPLCHLAQPIVYHRIYTFMSSYICFF